jgi:hypothetical protein
MKYTINSITNMNLLINFLIGIASFLIIKSLSDYIVARKKIKNNKAANNKVMSLLKSYVAGGQFPEKEVFDSIMISVSREYNIPLDALYTIEYYCDEFIKEILDNPYIPQEQKVQYTESLKVQMIDLSNNKIENNSVLFIDHDLTEKKFNYITKLFVFALFSGFITMSVSFVTLDYNVVYSTVNFTIVSAFLFAFIELILRRQQHNRIINYFRNRNLESRKEKILKHNQAKELEQIRLEHEQTEAFKKLEQDKKALEQEILAIKNERKLLEADKECVATETRTLMAFQEKITANQESISLNLQNIEKRENILKSEITSINANKETLNHEKELLILEKQTIENEKATLILEKAEIQAETEKLLALQEKNIQDNELNALEEPTAKISIEEELDNNYDETIPVVEENNHQDLPANNFKNSDLEIKNEKSDELIDEAILVEEIKNKYK